MNTAVQTDEARLLLAIRRGDETAAIEMLDAGISVRPGTAYVIGLGLQVYSPMQEAAAGISLPVLMAVQAACEKQHVEFRADEVRSIVESTLLSAPADIAAATVSYFRQRGGGGGGLPAVARGGPFLRAGGGCTC